MRGIDDPAPHEAYIPVAVLGDGCQHAMTLWSPDKSGADSQADGCNTAHHFD
jgi:hypothetical protein